MRGGSLWMTPERRKRLCIALLVATAAAALNFGLDGASKPAQSQAVPAPEETARPAISNSAPSQSRSVGPNLNRPLDHWWEVRSLQRRVWCKPDFLQYAAQERQGRLACRGRGQLALEVGGAPAQPDRIVDLAHLLLPRHGRFQALDRSALHP